MLRIFDYSDKALAVIGNTFPIKTELKNLGASFNKSLNIENNKVPGWIVPKDKKTTLL